MTTTANLGITLIDTAVSQPSVQANVALQAIEDAVTEWASIDVDDGTNTLTSAEVRESQFLVLSAGSPGLMGPIDVVLPAVKRMLVIRNDSGETATISCLGAATGAEEVTLATGAAAIVYNDGTQVYQLSSSLAGATAFSGLSDVPASYSGAAGKLPAVNSGETALEFKAAREFPLEINAQTGTGYTLALSDAGKLVTLDNAAAITLTVPAEATVDFPVGTQILLAQLGAQVTVAEGATAVTIITPETYALRKAGAQAALVKIAADTWLLEGNLELAP